MEIERSQLKKLMGLLNNVLASKPVVVDDYLVAFARAPEPTSLNAGIDNMPFKTCVGTGSNLMSQYAGQTVLVEFNKNSIQIVKPDGKKVTYFSAQSFCDQDIRKFNVQCTHSIAKISLQKIVKKYTRSQ